MAQICRIFIWETRSYFRHLDGKTWIKIITVTPGLEDMNQNYLSDTWMGSHESRPSQWHLDGKIWNKTITVTPGWEDMNQVYDR